MLSSLLHSGFEHRIFSVFEVDVQGIFMKHWSSSLSCFQFINMNDGGVDRLRDLGYFSNAKGQEPTAHMKILCIATGKT